jgi:hypothetical protein
MLYGPLTMLWKASEKANQGQCFSKATGLNEKQRDKQKASKSSRKVSAGLLMSLPDVSSKNGVYIVDTSPLYSALAGETSLTSLERVCQNLKLGPEFMHNAGNDAYVRSPHLPFSPRSNVTGQFTLLALEAMATGEAVTTQRAGWV